MDEIFDHAWTLDELAREANSSRSSVAKRFAELVGQPANNHKLMTVPYTSLRRRRGCGILKR